MKKFLAAVLCILVISSLAFPVFADKAIDATQDAKYATVIQMYNGKLPIVRDDAIFIPANDYTNQLTGDNIPGMANRTISIDEVTDWQPYFYDDFLIDNEITEGIAIFDYPVVWDKTLGPLSYTFSVPKDDLYEFVVVGAAQIKADAVDNDAKDRGFCYSVDDGQKYNVNISDTLGIFRDYSYSYTRAQADAEVIKTTNGENSKYYQMLYIYNLVLPLTKGEHVFNFYHLEYSGEVELGNSTSSRLNFAGFYVQRSLSDAELEAYVYPEITTLPEETTPEVTTAEQTTAEQTTAEEVVETTPAADVTTAAAPAVTTAAEPAKKGCGSSIAAGFVAAVAILGSAVVIRKRK